MKREGGRRGRRMREGATRIKREGGRRGSRMKREGGTREKRK